MQLIGRILALLGAAPPKTADQTSSIAFKRKQSLHATVIRACPGCGAPGVFGATEAYREQHPQLYRPDLDGQPVGDTCPKCLTPRPAPEPQGEIWRKVFH